MANTHNSDPQFPLFGRIVVGVGGAGVAVIGAVIAIRGQLSDRSGWTMDAPISAAIVGGLFIIAGVGAVIAAFFWRRKKQ